MRISVLGAGVAGVTTSWYLARDGHDVTLIDAAPCVAEGASHGNGAQLSYSYVAPLADPSVLPKLPGWLLNPSSPLRFIPRLDPDQWRWCLSFLRNCTVSAAARGTSHLLALGSYSRTAVHALVQETALPFDYQRNGKLVLYRDASAFEAAKRQLQYQAKLGSEQTALTPAGCVATDPAVAPLEKHLTGGILTPSEEAGDCARFTAALAEQAVQKYGLKLHLNTRITGLRVEGNRIAGVHTATGDIDADACVVALGNGSPALLSPHGIRLPVYPLQGYSLTAPIGAQHLPPKISITDLHHKIVYAKLGDRLRVAGMVDLVGRTLRPNPSRLALLEHQAKETFPNAADYDHAEHWCGARPATPDSMPLIGATPVQGLWINTGHGALGFTLSCGSARALADTIGGDVPGIDLTPFDPLR